MAEQFLGQIKLVAFNFAPNGYAMCNGQLMAIQQNAALFSLLGTTYGGNGTTTFALPDLRSRIPIHQGQGPGLSPYVLGEAAGDENVTLAQVPPHSHTLHAVSDAATVAIPTNNFLAQPPTGLGSIYAPGPAQTVMSNLGITGNNKSHENRQPYLTLTFVIALQGIFPSRN